MRKDILLTPGPSQVPPEAAAAAAKPIIHHRTEEFRAVLKGLYKDLKTIFGTAQDVLILASSGTGAMEACVVNTLSAGDTVIVGITGKFGERYSKICSAYGMKVVEIVKEWGESVTVSEVEKALADNPGARAVFMTHSETSSGVMNPIKEIAAVVKKTDALFIVDSISALGGLEMRMDEWGVDVVVSGSQKALMIPPGLAFIALSGRAWAAYKKSTLPKFYFDVEKYKKTLDKSGETPFTIPVTLCLALEKSIAMMLGEGLENVYKRHNMLSRACKAGVAALGLEIFTKPGCGSDVETVFTIPEGIDGSKLVKRMLQRFGLMISGGQEPYKGKIARIAHMGYCTEHDMILVLAGLEMCLAETGFCEISGFAVRAAEEVFQDEA